MSRDSVELEKLPDTGTLRSDLLALLKPYSVEHSERKFRVLSGLGSFLTSDQKISADVSEGIFGPWTEINRKLMKRAIERSEIAAHADIEMACQIIVSVCSYRSMTQKKPFDKAYYSALIDNMLLPALKSKKTSTK
jgi:hypothetical protein